MSSSGHTSPDHNFVQQQGFPDVPVAACTQLSSALRFQPRLVGLTVLVGAITQRPEVFGALAAALWWGALLPRWNLFDALYRLTLGRRSGAPVLEPAPPPRRFAQGMAASFATAIALCLTTHHWVAVWTLEGLLLAAIAALVYGRFCLGSFVYHLTTGRGDFAMRTLPWRRAGD